MTPSIFDPQADRALGAYLGLAIGDALGATVEFMSAREIAAQYRVHQEIIGGGWLHLKPGDVTDDTQMSLALGGAIVASNGWNLQAVAEAFLKWMLGMPIDIGHTCRRGIRRFMLEGTLCAPPSADNAGNGAVMRNLPVVLASLADVGALERRSIEQAHVTHNHELSDAATLALARMTRQLIVGNSLGSTRKIADDLIKKHPEFIYTPWPGQISGFVVDTIQTVFDVIFSSVSFEGAVVSAVNRGGDADTIGALTGQLAGAYHGARQIPERWLKRLHPTTHRLIREQTSALLAIGARTTA